MLVFSIIDHEGTYTINEQDSIWDKSSFFSNWGNEMIRKIDSSMNWTFKIIIKYF